MSSLSKDVKLVLKSQGWSEERDISSSLEFVQEKKLFPISKKVISNFGHLKVKDQGQHYNECIYFDVDDSLPSKNLRANVYGYEKFGMSGLEE